MPDNEPEVTLHQVDKRLTIIETRMTWAPFIASVVLIGIGWYVETATDQSDDIKAMLQKHDDEAHEARGKLEDRINQLDAEMKQSWFDQLKKQWDERNKQ